MTIDHEAAGSCGDGGEVERGVDGCVDEELPQPHVAVPDVEGAGEGAGADDGAGIGPGAIEGGEGIAGIAGDQQLVALLVGGEGVGATGEAGGGTVEPVETRQVAEIGQAQGEAVIARAGEIKGFDGGEAGGAVGVGGRLVGHSGEVEAEARAGESEGVDAAATIDAGELDGVAAGAEGIGKSIQVGAVELKAIVAAAAIEHIGAAIAADGVVAGIGHEGFAGGGAGKGVGGGGAELIDEGLGEGT